MTTLVGLLNRSLDLILGLACWPFMKLAPVWALIWVSLLTGILMLWIFGKVSDQKSIKKVKDRIRGNLIGVRLFQNELGVVMRLQGKILRDTLTYMKYSLIPMLILMIPVILILIQLNLRFSVRPLEPGKPAIVKVKVRDGVDLKSISLKTPEGIVVETPGVKIPSEREIAWRIRPEQEGDYFLDFSTGKNSLSKELVVGSRWGAISAVRTGKSVLEMLLWPGEAPLEASSPIESIEINYSSLPILVFGWDLHWLVLFFVLSIVFGFAFKDLFGVQI